MDDLSIFEVSNNEDEMFNCHNFVILDAIMILGSFLRISISHDLWEHPARGDEGKRGFTKNEGKIGWGEERGCPTIRTSEISFFLIGKNLVNCTSYH